MTTGVRVGLFAAALVVAFGGAYAVGDVVGPVGSTPTAMPHEGDAMGEMSSDHVPGGLQVAQDGYRLVLDDPQQRPDPGARVSFTIEGPGGEPLTDYDPLHGKRLHLVLARRDLSGFQHVHPTMDQSGRWTATVRLDPGQWRAFADFDPAGDDAKLTLGADLAVAGDSTPRPLPGASRTARVADYTITLDGDLRAGAESRLTLSVSRDGRPVTDLEPYLEAYGHLVALREGDLAYLHVHPEGEPGDGTTEAGPGVTFTAEVPSAGRYRLYLDFQHEGVVRTAELTAEAS